MAEGELCIFYSRGGEHTLWGLYPYAVGVFVGKIDYVFGRLALTTQVIGVEEARIIASANEQISDIYSINQELASKMVKKIVLDMSIAL